MAQFTARFQSQTYSSVTNHASQWPLVWSLTVCLSWLGATFSEQACARFISSSTSSMNCFKASKCLWLSSYGYSSSISYPKDCRTSSAWSPSSSDALLIMSLSIWYSTLWAALTCFKFSYWSNFDPLLLFSSSSTSSAISESCGVLESSTRIVERLRLESRGAKLLETLLDFDFLVLTATRFDSCSIFVLACLLFFRRQRLRHLALKYLIRFEMLDLSRRQMWTAMLKASIEKKPISNVNSSSSKF